MELEFSRQIFEEHSNIKFHENPFSGSEWTDRQTDRHMTNVVLAFRNIGNAPKIKPILNSNCSIFNYKSNFQSLFVSSSVSITVTVTVTGWSEDV
jgi:hypothetical protein